MRDAETILAEAQEALADRAATRDPAGQGERSMATAVATFQALTGLDDFGELDGWTLMITLKLARAQHGEHNIDDWRDLAAYAALAGECAERAASMERIRARQPGGPTSFLAADPSARRCWGSEEGGER